MRMNTVASRKCVMSQLGGDGEVVSGVGQDEVRAVWISLHAGMAGAQAQTGPKAWRLW